jgi:hypothetical protein
MTPPATTRQPPMRRSCSGGNSLEQAQHLLPCPAEQAKAPIFEEQRNPSPINMDVSITSPYPKLPAGL